MILYNIDMCMLQSKKKLSHHYLHDTYISICLCILRIADKNLIDKDAIDEPTTSKCMSMLSFFLSKHPVEISGFNQERHIQFLKYLENELGDIAFINDHISHSYDLTISQMKKSRKLLLITYNRPDMEKGQLSGAN